MSTRKSKRRKSKSDRERRQAVKTAIAVFLVVIVSTLGMSMCRSGNSPELSEEVRGIWVSYVDFGKLGLSNKSEAEFRENAEAFYERAEALHINTVYFHVRAFRDAVYISETFPVSRAIWSRPEKIPYDPLEIMVELAHEHEMELHAWMNPYRNSSFDQEILDPAEEATTEEILKSVYEVIENYDVDGIHFDDYFYNEGDDLSTGEKMDNVNRMIRQVYKAVHEADNDLVFGISPAGNISYSESLGADIRTWLSQDGYVDYIIPQIYWTDEHSAQWRDEMFSDTLDEWITLNTNDTLLYVGLALYKAGTDDIDDLGWKSSTGNIAFQIQIVREKRADGYAFFSAADLYRDSAADELKAYQELVF